MTAPEKAVEIYNTFMYILAFTEEALNIGLERRVKQCAIATCEEIIADHFFDDSEFASRSILFYKDVMAEIEKF